MTELSSEQRAKISRYVAPATIVVATLIGLAVRFAARDHMNPDATTYLLPWYEFARAGGIDSLRSGFTNYAPFYSYLLLVATTLHGLFPPLLLIKGISFIFEFGCALVVFRLVSLGCSSPIRPAIAFAATWMAPSVLYNGALWGQADLIWTFFVLLTIYLICRERYFGAMLAFAMAVSVKLQAVFLGPLVFALVLRGKMHWTWLASIPVVYMLIAIPTLALGRPLSDVLAIYLRQAESFRSLSKDAANLWLFVPNEFYTIGVAIGLVCGGVAGLAFSVFVAKTRLWSPQFIVLAAAVSLFLMPWILPKMHDRYFYAFELTSIVLAFLEPRLLLIAVVAQTDAVLSYLPFDLQGLALLGLPLAAILNTASLAFLIARIWTGEFKQSRYALTILYIIGIYFVWVYGIAFAVESSRLVEWWPVNYFDPIGLAAYLAFLALALIARFAFKRPPTAGTGEGERAPAVTGTHRPT